MYVPQVHTGHDDGTSGIDFSTVEERIKDILSFRNGKTERSEKYHATPSQT
jgi:hypothetical protein